MNRLGPSLATRWIIGIAVGAFFAIPLISTFPVSYTHLTLPTNREV